MRIIADPFKAYDIRGIYPHDVNENFALQLGKAVGTYIKGETIVVARDGRKSGDELYTSLIKGIISTGKNVVAIGKVTTPQFYFSIYSSTASGGVMITASHNPKEYNGFKICSENAKPIFQENGLLEIKKIMLNENFNVSKNQGHIIKKIINHEYIESMKKLSFELNKKYKILIDNGNGMGILEVKALKQIFKNKIQLEVLFPEIDGNFPNHECNPSVNENLKFLTKHIQEGNYDFGAAFDGDADRIVFVTKEGEIIPADIMTGIIGSEYVKKGELAGYEVRSSRVVKELFLKKKLKQKMYKSGHAYIKQGMKEDKARFAGEKSGHYFYQNLHYTDSSLYTMMNVLKILENKKVSLGKIAKPLMEKYPNSGEVNYQVHNADNALKIIKKEFENKDVEIIEIDGISVYSKEYFFNVRKSNTEPLVRVNIEGDTEKIVKDLKLSIERILSRA